MVVAADWLSFVPPVIGLAWTVKELLFIRSIKLTGHTSGDAADLKKESVEGGHNMAKSLELMKDISKNIADGATAFLVQEYKYMLIFVAVAAVVIGLVEGLTENHGWQSVVSFILGSVTSIACGYIGMKTAVFANVRTAHESIKDLSSGFEVALRAGSVMGFVLVSLGVITMYILIKILDGWFGEVSGAANPELFTALAGYGLGGSSIALFGRVGGGIFTKAADVGADLSGKNEYGMNEDDPRNPACIADNVGDNVGDIAGMGADLFGSFAEATCAAMVICTGSGDSDAAIFLGNWNALLFPLLLTSTGIIVGIVTMFAVAYVKKVRELSDVEFSLKFVLIVSTVMQTAVTLGLCALCIPDGISYINWWKAFVCVLAGLWAGLAIGLVTEYYTSHTYRPVREIAESQRVSAATGIIFGLAVGYMSCIVPVIALAATICIAHTLGGMYGISLAALGMLGTLTIALTIDAYGPISDNAGGIAEMSELGPDVRRRTDALDAAGNTTAAIGKGFAIGSAALVSLALFGAFCVRTEVSIVSNFREVIASVCGWRIDGCSDDDTTLF
jgi:H+-translocating diphosphatase